MDEPIALILSDLSDRLLFLENHFGESGMYPVSYPNHGAYLLHMDDHCPTVFVVDMSLPVENKVDLIAAALKKHPEMRVLIIGKREYLEEQGTFAGQKNVCLCDDLGDL